MIRISKLTKLQSIWVNTTNVHLMNETYINSKQAIEVEDGRAARIIEEDAKPIWFN